MLAFAYDQETSCIRQADLDSDDELDSDNATDEEKSRCELRVQKTWSMLRSKNVKIIGMQSYIKKESVVLLFRANPFAKFASLLEYDENEIQVSISPYNNKMLILYLINHLTKFNNAVMRMKALPDNSKQTMIDKLTHELDAVRQELKDTRRAIKTSRQRDKKRLTKYSLLDNAPPPEYAEPNT